MLTYNDLKNAIIANDILTVKESLKNKNIALSSNKNELFRLAAELGYIDIATLLINKKSVNPNDKAHIAIRNAAEQGHIEIVKLILNHKKFIYSDKITYAIVFAIRQEHYDIAYLLINDKRIPLDKYENAIIKTAFNYKLEDMIDLIWKDKAVRNTLINDDNELYNIFTQQNITNKLIEF